MAPTGTRRRVLRAVLPAAVLLGAGLLASPATAHTELVASDPADGDVLSAPPQELTLTFNEEVSSDFATVVLSTDDNEPRRLETSNASGNVLLATVDPDLTEPDAADGGASWRVDYRVTSEDGHPIEGSVAFKVETSASAAPSPTREERTPPGHAPEDAGDATSGRSSGWAFLSGPAAVLGLLAMLTVVLGVARLAAKGLPTTRTPTGTDSSSRTDEGDDVDESVEQDDGDFASSEATAGEPAGTPDGSRSDPRP